MFLRDFIFYIGLIFLHAIALLLDVVLLPLHYFIQQPWKVINLSRRIKAVKIHTSAISTTWRSLETPKSLHLEISREKLDTMADVMEYFSNKYKDRNCFGTRQILNEENEVQDGKSLLKYTLGKYVWKNFKECNNLAENFGKGVRSLLDSNTGKRSVAIFAETRSEWMLAIQGLFKQNFAVVTVYANLGDDGIIHALNETEIEILITSYDLMPKVKSIISKLPQLKKIIYMEDQIKTIDSDDYNFNDIGVLSFESVLNSGKKSTHGNRFPNGSDLAIIMYTSGSTGVPKGVQILHSNLVAVLKAFADITENIGLKKGERLLGFLPLAHVFELVVECVALCSGISIGYSTPLTLLDTSPKIKAQTKGDVSILKPHIMTSVPLIMDRIVKGIEDKVNNGSVGKKILFYFALRYKLFWYPLGFSTPILNRLVFHKVSKLLGGSLRFILSGGAPLTPKTQGFIEAVLNIKVLQGYGLTETTSCATVMDSLDRSFGRVGAPTTVCDITLMNWEEGGYYITNKPYPRGEIVVGGANVTKGYFKQPEKNRQDYFVSNEVCWFKTGDIGEMQSDGCIRIVDRIKDIIKLQNGLFISLGKVEAVLKTCSLVENICVHADSTRNHSVALVTPNEQKILDLGKTLKIKHGDFKDLCRSTILNHLILEEIIKIGTKSGLEKFEIPKVIILLSDAWTPESGLVTAAMKLKRKEILAKYSREIRRLYEEKFD